MANAGNPASIAQPAAGQPNAFQKASSMMDGAAMGTIGAAAGPNIGRFFNPFTQNVVGNTLDTMGRARDMTMMDTAAGAMKAGAYGGSRHGIADSETNRNFFDSVGNTVGNLNMQGFNTALGAGQNQQQMELAAAGQLGGLGQTLFGMGQTVNQNLNQQGAQNQGLMQMLIDAAKGQYAGYTGAPKEALQLPLAAVGGANMGQNTQTTQQNPGLLNIFSTLLSAIPG